LESNLNKYIVNFYFDEEKYLKVPIKSVSDEEIHRVLTKRTKEGSNWIKFPDLCTESKTINMAKVLYYEINRYIEPIDIAEESFKEMLNRTRQRTYQDLKDEDFLVI
jgi:hypothetical protein